MENDNSVSIEKDSASSVELTKSVKGEYSWKIKVYFGNETKENPVDRAFDMDAQIREKLKPKPSTG